MAAPKILSDIGEFGLINRFKKMVYAANAVVSIGDDAAVLPFTKTKYQLLTTDMLVEDVHFTARTEPKLIGRKAMNCNISDIAAMGGFPKYAVVTLGAPARTFLKRVEEIYRGINQAAKTFGIGVVGGDTVKSTKLMINIALTGDVLKKDLVLRSTAKIGDMIFVTGALGGSLKSGRHLTFTPRVKESQFLVKHFKPTAMIDISDGLIADLGHILETSRKGAVIHEEKIPRQKGADLHQALFDGEDFELIFTLPKKQTQRLERTKHPGMKFYPIGEITAHGLTLKTTGSVRATVKQTGYRHF